MSASTPATTVNVTAPLNMCSAAEMAHSAKLPKLNNPNVSLNVSTANSLVSNLLAVESACTTPRTPEILNSLIAMTNPLDDYNYNASEKCATGGPRVRNRKYTYIQRWVAKKFNNRFSDSEPSLPPPSS